MKQLLISLVRDDQGQDLVEYAMLVALIAILCVAGVGTFGSAVNTFFNGIAASVPIT